MDYIILNKAVTINGVNYGDFLFITDINTEANIANVNISNTAMIFSVPITSTIEESINEYFINDIEV